MVNSQKNLIPQLNESDWITWIERPDLSPSFERGQEEGMPVLRICSNGNQESYGKWQCKINGINGGGNYRFSIEYRAEQIPSVTVSVSALLTWCKDDGVPLQRDYVDKIQPLEDGWVSLYRIIAAPEDAEMLIVELVLRWPGEGSVTWRKPCLQETEHILHRRVRVATTLLNMRHLKHTSLEQNLEGMIHRIDQAGQLKPDIICLGEKNYDDNLGLPLSETAETIPGRLTRVMGEKARQYGCYIIYSMSERDGDLFYNTAVLTDRNGNVAGKYRKTHLPLSEAESGYSRGTEYPVFNTDFGTIGIMICWDQTFPSRSNSFTLFSISSAIMLN
jgi:hypothetical protein